MSKLKISVIEDNPTESFLLKMALSGLKDLEVNLYQNGQSLIESLETVNAQFFLVDINLPDISGTELCKLIREKNKNAVIIVMSAQDHVSVISDLQKMNISNYIVKNKSCLTYLKHILDKEMFLFGNGYYKLDA